MVLVSPASAPASPAGRRLALVLLAAFALRLVLIAATAGLEPRIVDEQHYHQLASSLADGRGFAFSSGPTSLRPPLYPAFVAGTWAVTGSRSLVPVRLAQAALAVMTAWLVFLAGRAVYNARAGFIAACITAFYPSLVFANVLLLTETLFACLLMAVVVVVLRLLRHASWQVALGAGLLIGLAALTRSVVWPLPFVLAPLAAWWTPGPLVRRAAVGVAILAGFAIVVGPWAVRNTRLQGVPVLVDTMGGMNLRMGNYEHTPHDRIWDAVSMRGERSWIVGLPSDPPSPLGWTEGWKERWAREQAVAFMREHPGLTLRRAAIKFGDFWALERDFAAGVEHGLYRPPPAVSLGVAAITIAAFPLIMLLAVRAVFVRPPPDWRAHAWLLLLILFVCALHTVVFGHPRYRLPLTPVLAIYAGATLGGRTWRGVSGRSWQTAAAAAVSVGLVVLWAVQFAWRDWPFVERLLARLAS